MCTNTTIRNQIEIKKKQSIPEGDRNIFFYHIFYKSMIIPFVMVQKINFVTFSITATVFDLSLLLMSTSKETKTEIDARLVSRKKLITAGDVFDAMSTM